MSKESINLTQPEIPQLCPYWRQLRVAANSYWILALCGAESPNELSLPDNDIGSRLRECPWYHQRAVLDAYQDPGIFAANMITLQFRQILASSRCGLDGIAELEGKWEDACKLFDVFIQKAK